MNQSSARRRPHRNRPPVVRASPTGKLLPGGLAGLLMCSLLWPSEGAVQGDGLHLVSLWLVLFSGYWLWQWWQTDPQITDDGTNGNDRTNQPRFSSRLAGTGLTLFVIGTWLSVLWVFQVSGDRRAAVNLGLEWTAIGAAGWLCHVACQRYGFQQILIRLLIALSLGLCVFALWNAWQLYVVDAQDYLAKREILDAGTDPVAISRIRQQFQMQGIPLEGSGRQLIEKRLLGSSELLGPFALANTLGGVLAAGLVMCTGCLLSQWSAPQRRHSQLILLLFGCMMLTWCLLQTKSRTAWVGAAAGILVWVGTTRWKSQASADDGKRPFKLLLVLVLLAGLLTAGGVATGVIDREVVLEAPRSLQFRLFYWMGAAQVIAESPLFGAGPGNFRQAWLPFRPPECSEAVLDPHNVLFDAWCFAGAIGFAGFLCLAAAAVLTLRSKPGGTLSDGRDQVPRSAAAIPGTLVALIVLFGWEWLSGSVLEVRHAMLLMTVLITAAAGRWLPPVANPSALLAAAATALLVHLLGAGGLQITGLGGLLVILIIAASTGVPSSGPPPLSRRVSLTVAGAGTAVLLLSVGWGLWPVNTARISESLSTSALYRGDRATAVQYAEQAIQEDPWSPAARQQLVRSVTYDRVPVRTTTDAGLSETDIEQILEACSLLKQADHRQYLAWQTQGEVCQQLYERTENGEYLELCVEALQTAVKRNPGDAGLRTRLAEVLHTAGTHDRARHHAEQALHQEQINQTWGHSDQFLTPVQLDILNQILKPQ